MFDDNKCTGVQARTAFDHLAKVGYRLSSSIRWISNNKIECLGTLFDKSNRIFAQDAILLTFDAERVAIVFDGGTCSPRTLDKGAVGCATAQRFNSQRSSSRK